MCRRCQGMALTICVLIMLQVLDSCRGLQEILDLYRRLEWPDCQTAAQVFTPAILNIISDVASSYAAQVEVSDTGKMGLCVCGCDFLFASYGRVRVLRSKEN